MNEWAMPGAARWRLMALRAVMDGRGVDAVLVTARRSVAFLSASADAPDALLVTASDCVRVARPPLDQAGWDGIVARLRPGWVVGYESAALDPGQVGRLRRALVARRATCLSADIARLIADDAAGGGA